MASKKANDANMILRANMRRIRKSTGLNQETFYNTYLKDLPFAPGASSGATAANALSEIEKGARPVPDSFLPVYARLGHISIDRLLTGQDWTPDPRAVTYGDALRVLSALLLRKAAALQQDGKGISAQDPVLINMLCGLENVERLRPDISPGDVEAIVQGRLVAAEMQEPVFDATNRKAAAARKISAALLENEAEGFDKMLNLIRLVSK